MRSLWARTHRNSPSAGTRLWCRIDRSNVRKVSGPRGNRCHTKPAECSCAATRPPASSQRAAHPNVRDRTLSRFLLLSSRFSYGAKTENGGHYTQNKQSISREGLRMDLSAPRTGPRGDDSRGGQSIEADGAEAWERSPFLSRRFVVGSLVAFGILVANAAVSYRITTNLIEASDTVDNTLQFVSALKGVQESVVNAETELRGYIISGERERLIDALTFLGKARNLVEPLYVLSAAPEQHHKVEALDAMIGQEIDRFGRLIDIHRQQGLTAAIRAIRDTAGRAMMRPIQVLAAELAADGDSRLRRRSEQSRRSSGLSVVNTVVAILLNVGLLGAVVLLARREIRERRQAEEVVKFAATHDPLTGLPNRLLLSDRATRALAAAASEKRSVAMLFVDLDRFKNIND